MNRADVAARRASYERWRDHLPLHDRIQYVPYALWEYWDAQEEPGFYLMELWREFDEKQAITARELENVSKQLADVRYTLTKAQDIQSIRYHFMALVVLIIQRCRSFFYGSSGQEIPL